MRKNASTFRHEGASLRYHLDQLNFHLNRYHEIKDREKIILGL